MKAIFQIAKTELRTFFCSPIAWFVLVVFAVQAGLTFTDVYESQFGRTVMGWFTSGISSTIFNGWRVGVFPLVQQYLFLYVPILTMGLMSRETSSGSIKLLLSSPVSSKEIIVGKYLSMMVVGLVMTAIILIQVVFCFATVEGFDLGAIMTGLLGFYLLICAYSAIGLFMSCLFDYQVLAAVCTIALLAVLNYVGALWQDVPVIREVTYWLSLSGRTSSMYKGLISTEDILYFIIIILLFLGLSNLKLYYGRKRVSIQKKTLTYAGLCIAAFALGVASIQPHMRFYCDATQMKGNSLKPEYQEVVRSMEGGVTITSFVNLFDNDSRRAYPESRLSDENWFSQYTRFKPDMKLRYIYYYDNAFDIPEKELKETARKAAIMNRTNLKRFKAPGEIANIDDLRAEDYRFVRLIERDNGQWTWLRMFDDLSRQPSESEVIAAFKKISMPLPIVYFLEGHDERRIDRNQNKDYHFFANGKHFRKALINQGFDARNCLVEDLATHDLSRSMVVIADPVDEFSLEDLSHISLYIENGGNLILAVDENSVDNTNKVAAMLGLKFADGLLLQKHEELRPDLILAQVAPEAESTEYYFHWLHKAGNRISVPGATFIDTGNVDVRFTVTTMMVSDTTNGWFSADIHNIVENPVPDTTKGEKYCSYPVSVALSRQVGEREQRIFVIGDSDWISDGELKSSRPDVHASNVEFAMQLFKWFAYGEVPLSAGRKGGPDNNMHFTSGLVPWLRTFFWGVIPGILLFAGTAWLIRRRRK